jgi:molybdopterin-guanine dinucleotide biosynthesis protein A
VQTGLSNGIGQIELSYIGPNQNQTPTLGLRKLDPEKGGKQGELAGIGTCLKCIPKGWLVVAANAGSHDPVRVL